MQTINDASAEIVRGFQERPIAGGIRGMFDAEPVAPRSQKSASAPRPEPSARTESTSPAAQSGATPELTYAREHIAANPDMIIRTEGGVDVKASDALRAADEEITRATNESSAFQAAVACALRFPE
jgi:hypothetical protein